MTIVRCDMDTHDEGRTISASRLRSDSVAILDQVDKMKFSYTITKDGRPVAKLVPADAEHDDRDLMGSVTLIAEDDEAYYSTGEVWDAERGML